MANPLPLGSLTLSVATFGFGALQLGWVTPAEGSTIALAVLVLTVPLQLLAPSARSAADPFGAPSRSARPDRVNMPPTGPL
jgi:hypothetical protein